MATQATPATSPSAEEMLRSASPQDRLRLLRELVKLCFADGSLDKPLKVTDDRNAYVGVIAAMFPRTQTPLPELTDDERADLQRTIADRKGVMSEKEFISEVRRRINERAENARS